LAISSLMILLKVVSSFPVLSSCSVFKSHFLRYRGRPPPRSFALFLPSWCARIFWIPRLALVLAPCHFCTVSHP
jgi:hypothetical protein